MARIDQNLFNPESLGAADNFRLLLDAMARPGKVFHVPEKKQSVSTLNAGAVTTLLALSDHETPVWLDPNFANEEVVDFLKFNCGCPMVDETAQAMFAVLPSDFDWLNGNKFAVGTPAFPDQSTTLIIQVSALDEEGSSVLSGPGIQSARSLHVEGLSHPFWNWRVETNKNFPLGIDVFLVTDDRLAALPRTTQVREIA